MTSLSRSSEQQLYQALIAARMFKNKLDKRNGRIGDSYLDEVCRDLQHQYFTALQKRTYKETSKNNASVRNLISSAWKRLQSH